MSTSRAALLALTLALTGCGSAPEGPAPAAAAAVATVFLPPDATVTIVTVPEGAGQVVLRLGGTLGDVDRLTAELTPAASPDAARRWPVDAAPKSGADGAAASITLPAYALPPGDYTATVWEGDANVVRGYRFTVAR